MKSNGYSVYCHTNKINNKKYIGITSQKVSDRWANGKGYKRCYAFDRAIQKYGWEEFAHEVLFTALSKQDAEKKEIELIAKWDTVAPHGYNLESGGSAGKKEHNQSIKKANKSREDKYSKVSKTVVCVNTGKTYKSVGEAARQSGAHRISECCNGYKRFSGKDKNGIPLIWRFISNGNTCPFSCSECQYASCIYSGTITADIFKNQNLGKFERGHPMTKQMREILDKATQKKVLQINAETNQIMQTYESIRDASLATGVRRNTIGEVCSGYKGQRRKTAGGYVWKYADAS